MEDKDAEEAGDEADGKFPEGPVSCRVSGCGHAFASRF
jgi:hypothetical protein